MTPCFVSKQLKVPMTDEEEYVLKWAASSLYGGGADTVGSVTMHHHQRLIVTVPPETDSLR